jgi:signal transduction histidine kinase/ActR/RegA family two-component response regulator
VQGFLNLLAQKRADLSALSPLHASLAACVLGVAVGLNLSAAAIWTGAIILALHARAVMRQSSTSNIVSAISDVTVSATACAAPVMIWMAGEDSLAVAMLATLAIGILNESLADEFSSLTPLAIAGVAFALFGGGATLAALVCVASAGWIAHRQIRAARTTRTQDEEWVRQLNMVYGEARSAAWEIDYTTQRLIGGANLARVLGRPVTYDDIVSGCLAPEHERALVSSTLGPNRGPTRRISLVQTIMCADGSHLSVRHEGFLRADENGAPLRLLCFSQPSQEAKAGIDHRVLRTTLARTEKMLEGQARALLVLSNELGVSNAIDPPPHDATQSDDLPSRLARQVELVESRRRAIAQSIDDLVRAHHEAQAASIAKSQFLASMSHELRTPLNAIIGYAEMLHEDAEDQGETANAQDLSRILSSARHLLNLLNEILDLSKIEAGRMEVFASAFDTRDLLEETIATVRPMAEQSGNRITLSCEIGEATTESDATKLRQCVLNLLSNACKFTKDGQIDVAADIRAHQGVPQLFITVTDTGIGISDEQMPRLFQPFVQADSSIAATHGGTGLGLTITRRLAQLMGGDVGVSSTFGLGACFTLHIPANSADAAAARGAAVRIDERQGAEDAPLVLVIEDEADARELAARALTRAGFAVQGVGGGEAGLTLARSKQPALILLDIFLPDRSGWRVLQSLKHDPKTRDIPVIVLSVNDDRTHALALGAAEHMTKPADRDQLAAAVMRFARGRPALAAAIKPASLQYRA